ncbi:uncharacterized protein AB675_9544 [Cyphellophora attinorum]|uniref:F-box domain-containing protein n=1 Tax=Cyphellophora attinorum TaxID=1664694 RepID=A0A0N1P1J9_9EURO|nr:uncharacterized protein AB675_9544 [Phialophora attinorum]KPI42240.1 hypothetical protein AB675_9544 [Phialophora attinorum]
MKTAIDLPDEIWQPILEYLTPRDSVALQCVSKRFLRLARDNKLWRRKCFEKRPNAGNRAYSHRDPAVWDPSAPGEDVNWYDEYIARHAPLHTVWSEGTGSESHEILGVAVDEHSERAVGWQEDGSILIWDIREQELGGRRIQRVANSSTGVLFATNAAQSSTSSGSRSFTSPTESIALDFRQNRAYIAVGPNLNEVDLETLQVISQQEYAWSITALSQHQTSDLPLSVGTLYSLHLYDPRMTFRDRSRSPEDMMRPTPGEPENSIAFLPNHAKFDRFRERKALQNWAPSQQNAHLDYSAPRHGRGGGSHAYAQVEPGPLSILHYEQHEIFLAGRFPSILSYDRRYFPRLQYVVHSGATLSSLTSVPYAPKPAQGGQATLIAAGEYKGRGSLELYSLPYATGQPTAAAASTDVDEMINAAADAETAEDDNVRNVDITHTDTFKNNIVNFMSRSPYSYKNRQDAAPAKILSVATQGTRIVFSDANGCVHWKERDSRELVRRWNINDASSHAPSAPQEPSLAATNGARRTSTNSGADREEELVVRKLVPLSYSSSSSTKHDILLHTPAKLCILTTQPQYADHETLARSFEAQLSTESSEAEEERERAEEYAREMRRALERQADERIWMGRFRLRG